MSPQIYSHKFDKSLFLNALYYLFHRMSSRFTAEGENARRKNGRIKDKSVRNVPGPIKEEREIREGKAKNKKGGTGKWERVEKPQTTRSR